MLRPSGRQTASAQAASVPAIKVTELLSRCAWRTAQLQLMGEQQHGKGKEERHGLLLHAFVYVLLMVVSRRKATVDDKIPGLISQGKC